MQTLASRPAAALSALIFCLALPLTVCARDDAPRPDVLVVGGTPAGVAAAVAAARRGERVTLVSADDQLGGVLTGAWMDQWDLNLAPDGTTVERGMFAEIYDRLGNAFAPGDAARLFAQMVASQPRIDLVCDERAVAVATTPLPDGSSVDDVTFRNVRSNATMTEIAPYVVDATDFGDVAALAGARYDVGRQDSGLDDRTQAVTLVFGIEGIDWPKLAATYDAAVDGPGGVVARTAWGYSRTLAAYAPLSDRVLVRDLNLGLMADGTVTANAIDVVGVDALSADEVLDARSLSETEAPRLVAFLRRRLPGFERARVGRFASEVYVRETRHIAGLERLDASDVWFGKIPADSIGLSSYPLDLHPVDAGDRQAFAPVRHVYGIPFGTMVPRGFDNLVVAGPAISASHLASGSARVIPTTIEEGEAAGVACADADRAGIDIERLALSEERIVLLRRDLAREGALVGTPSSERVERLALAVKG